MRFGVVGGLAATLALSCGIAAPADADPSACNEVSCVPGIAAGAVLGAPCSDTSHFVFATTSAGRLLFCGSPRRYEPRYFRSPLLWGVREENSPCTASEDNGVAQAPDGLFLTCAGAGGETRWIRGDA